MQCEKGNQKFCIGFFTTFFVPTFFLLSLHVRYQFDSMTGRFEGDFTGSPRDETSSFNNRGNSHLQMKEDEKKDLFIQNIHERVPIINAPIIMMHLVIFFDYFHCII